MGEQWLFLIKGAVCIQPHNSSLLVLIYVRYYICIALQCLFQWCFLWVWWIVLVGSIVVKPLILNLFPLQKMFFTHWTAHIEFFAQGKNSLWLPSFSLKNLKKIKKSKWDYTDIAYISLYIRTSKHPDFFQE